MTISSLSLVSLLLACLIFTLTLVTGKKSLKDREKLSPFECGFDPFKKARVAFSLRFFLVTIIFLIFDIEVALLLPLGVITYSAHMKSLLLATLSVMVILILGLAHEWNQGALNWL
nr:NADH dehydrogenase subunit 3 [Eusirus cf. giganteus clade g1]UIN24710.1 NADH dehydrogenase subunit 3 [Eusirus cf. giganteus clade g2]